MPRKASLASAVRKTKVTSTKQTAQRKAGRKHMVSNFLIFLFFLLLAVALFFVFFQSQKPHTGHLTLLTVATTDENTSYGGTADVYLTIRPGKGNVYIDTFPFTKLDTQISTRFAKEVACTYTGAVCDRFDFFYTIRADSSIVGGPSAGAALSALTAALLQGDPIDDSVAVTGTINSGGLIGPVGGVSEKVSAAQKAGIRTVLVPKWSNGLFLVDDVSNASSNVSAPIITNTSSSVITDMPLASLIANASPRADADITVVEVATLDEVLAYITDMPFSEKNISLSIPEDYVDLMSQVADLLCQQTDELLLLIPNSSKNLNNTLFNQSQVFIAQSEQAKNNSLFYSRASYCFSANLRLRQLQTGTLSPDELALGVKRLRESINKAFVTLDEEPMTSFTDLQTKAIVSGRLKDARSYILKANVTSEDFAYAWERYRSAVVWSSFFSLKGAPLQLDEAHLQSACEKKLAEVEERKSYADILFGNFLQLDHESLQTAYAAYQTGDYSLCVFEASKAKAEIDVVLSSISMTEETFSDLLETKLHVAASLLERELARGNMPLMAYSYYEYAGTLIDSDPYTAALYSSYALELSDLSAYFPKVISPWQRLLDVLTEPFVLGLFAGMSLLLAGLLLFASKK